MNEQHATGKHTGRLPVVRSRRLASIVAGLSLASLVSLPAQAWDTANVPLFWSSGAMPNVMMLVDDSGSMHQLTYSAGYAKYLQDNPTTANAFQSTDIDDASDPHDTIWSFCTALNAAGNACTNATISMDMGWSSFSVQTPINGGGNYIYRGPGGSTNRPSSPGTHPLRCNVTSFVSSKFSSLTTGSTVPFNNLGVMVTNAAPGSVGSISACVRWKEAATAVSPRAVSGTSCVATSTMSSQESPTGTIVCPGSIDVFTSYEMPYAHWLLTRNVTASGIYNFANTISTTPANPEVITQNTSYPNTTTGTITDPLDPRIIPNVNRIDAARQSALKVVADNRTMMRIGLARFNGQSGADIRQTSQGSLIGAGVAALNTQITRIRAEDSTPLAEAYYEVLRYFHGLVPEYTTPNGSSAFPSPIQYRCQKNFTLVMTDGEPSSDIIASSSCDTVSKPSTTLTGMPTNYDYDGVADACLTSSIGIKYQPIMDDLSQWAYEKDAKTTSSTVAACYGGETVPSAAGVDCSGKSWDMSPDNLQNITTYTVGFGLKNDMLVQTPETLAVLNVGSVDTAGDALTITAHGLSTGDSVVYRKQAVTAGTAIGGLVDLQEYYVIKVNNNVIRLATDVANASNNVAVDITSAGTGTQVISRGPGKFYLALTAEELSSSLASAFSSINEISSSASAVATNSKNLTGTSMVYAASFETKYWSGDLAAYPINSNGTTGSTPAWKASQTITAGSRGVMLTNNGAASNPGVLLDYNNLTTAQKTEILNDANVITWLKGSPVTGATGYRGRPKGIVGDIINSDPVYVGAPINYGYSRMAEGNNCVADTSGTSYASGSNCTGAALYAGFRLSNASRPGVLYFGANDGQLHGVRDTTGAEVMSYIPSGVYSDWDDTDEDGVRDTGEIVSNKLRDLTRNTYRGGNHKYFVDGSPTVADAYWGGSWKTVLLTGLNGGGRTISALNVTNTTFDTGDVLWDFPNAGTAAADKATMGYTYSKPILVRMQNGDFAAVFGNGYDSGGDDAFLYIVKASDGSLLKKIGVSTASTDTPTSENGLSSVAVELDSNRTAVAFYAGDLKGNVWKFDVSSQNVNGWKLSHKVFQATDTSGNPQPITGGMAVGSNPVASGTMVFFGTGKYFETVDQSYTASSTPRVDTFYGILDAGSTVAKSALVQQTFSPVGSIFRSASNNTVVYSGSGAKSGWYINLAIGSTYEGERVVSTPMIHGGRVIFVSLIPQAGDRCSGGGSSWLNELDALDGTNLGEAVFDTNGNGTIDSSDALVAGIFNEGGIISEPVIIDAGDKEFKLSGTSKAANQVVTTAESKPPGTGAVSGRMSWMQLQ